MGVDPKLSTNVEAEEAGGESQSKKAAKKLAKDAAKAAKVMLNIVTSIETMKFNFIFVYSRKPNTKRLLQERATRRVRETQRRQLTIPRENTGRRN